MSISFRLRPATLFVAGALLVPCAAFAQDANPSITPSDSTLAPVPSSVGSPAPSPANTQPIIDGMTFRDIDVTELLAMVSAQFNVPIAISDVSGRIKYINLSGKTPEQAIDTIVKTAGLSSEKQADGTYIISKAAPVVVGVTPDIQPLPAITSGFGGGNRGNSTQNTFNSPTANITTADPNDEPKLDKIGNGTDSKMRTYQMSIRNVKASLMAFWLDPANHEAPVDIRLSKELEGRYGNRKFVTDSFGGNQMSVNSGNGNGNDQQFNPNGIVPNGNPYLNSNAEVQTRSNAQFGGGNNNNNNNNGGGRNGNNNNNGGRGNGGGRNGNGGVFQLPEGVDRIVAVDPQNALLVFGTAQGARDLAATIAFLDRPLRQVEIEAQFVSINTSDAKTYGFDFSTARGNFNASSTGNTTSGGLQVGFLRGNFQAQISAATSSGRAKLLTAPRVTAINNLTATLDQTTSTPIVLTTTNTIANNSTTQNTSQQVFYVTTTIGLEVTPTINNDDTVTVLMRPVLQSQGTPNSLGASQITSQQLETIANVRDGETIALGGLRSKNISLNKTKVPLLGDIPFIGPLFTSRNNSEIENELIIFLTARIIRRAGDDDSVIATGVPVGAG